MKETQELKKISKLFQRISLLVFFPIWIELIMIFTKYSSPLQLFYNEYGNIGIVIYFGLIFTCVLFFARLSSKIDSIVFSIENLKRDNKFEI